MELVGGRETLVKAIWSLMVKMDWRYYSLSGRIGAVFSLMGRVFEIRGFMIGQWKNNLGGWIYYVT